MSTQLWCLKWYEYRAIHIIQYLLSTHLLELILPSALITLFPGQSSVSEAVSKDLLVACLITAYSNTVLSWQNTAHWVFSIFPQLAA